MRTVKPDDDFADYGRYLHTNLWPSSGQSSGRAGTEVIAERDYMPPQYAAAALAKLVRWARLAPAGDAALHMDEDSRENFVRTTRLGMALAARACNLEEEHFHGLYGEYAAGKEADQVPLLIELAVSLGDHGVDWPIRERAVLADKLLADLAPTYKIVKRASI